MPTPPPILRQHIDRLEAFQRAVAADRFLVSTGQKPTADPTPFTEFADLADGRLIRALIDDGHIDWARELLRDYFRAALREATDRLRHAERTLTADWDGRPHTHAELLAIQRTNPPDRDALSAAIGALLARLSEEHRHWLAAYADARARLGFRDHGAFVRVLYPDVDRWAEHAEQWLARTRGDFLTRWAAWRERDGLAHPLMSDLQAVGASVPAPPGAPAAVDVAQATIGSWGFETEVKRIDVDTAVRPGKAPMAFCSPVAPPTDVRVSVHDSGRMPSYVSTLHEFAHGVHFTAAPARPAELWPAHPAVTECFGLAIELIARRTDWQRHHLGRELGPDDIDRLVFARDAVQRIIAASVGYELAVHDGAADPPAEFARVFARELAIQVTPLHAYSRLQNYLQGQPFYPLIYHQAFTLRDAMWRDLARAGGDHWYMDDAVHDHLLERFRLAAEADLHTWMRTLGVRAFDNPGQRP